MPDSGMSAKKSETPVLHYHTLWTSSSLKSEKEENDGYMLTIPKFVESSIDFRPLIIKQTLVGSSNSQKTMDLISNEDMYQFLGRDFCPRPIRDPSPDSETITREVEVVKNVNPAHYNSCNGVGLGLPPAKPPRLPPATSAPPTQSITISSSIRKAPKPLPRTKFLYKAPPPKLPARPPVSKGPYAK